MSKNQKESKRRYQENLNKEAQISTKNSTIKNFQTKNTPLRQKKQWTAEEDEKLTNLINLEKIRNFTQISRKMPGRSAAQCSFRWNKIKKGLKKGQWSLYEDKLLREWIKQNGPRKWEQCGKFIHGRSGKQCREHWNNCLNPELIKGEWTIEEDFLIMHFYEKCNGSWKKIIHLFNGRTENSIKNRFFSQLRKIATKDMTVSERKFCSKIKLEELKNFLNEAISDTKRDFLKENPMNEEELKEYLNKMELKIKQKVLEENEKNGNNKIISNLDEIENNEINILKNENKEKKFIGKRKRSTEELFDNSTENENEEDKNIKIQNDKIINDNNINLDEDKENLKNEIFNNNISTNEIRELEPECKNIFYIDNKNINSDNLYNYEDDNQSKSTITCIDSRPCNIFNDIIENIDYQYKPSYNFLENCRLYRTNSLGNILIVDNNNVNFEQNYNSNEEINDFNEDNITWLESR